MADEKKPVDAPVVPPAGDAPANPPAPNQGPSVEDLQKQIQEVQTALKEKDAKIADLETTRATIEARQRQLDEAKLKQTTDTELKERIRQINERRAYDPDGADTEMASLLSEREKRIAEEAVTRATGAISQQTAVERIRMGVKNSNPDLDDELVDDIMAKANMLASTGQYKTADEAVNAATKYVKGKLDKYAQIKNALPSLPPGAGAEGGGGNRLPPPAEPLKEKSALEEIEDANEAKSKKLI